ncbi:uncharacterized protein LOC132192588 isoform X2 [Neocloeon triangulifer]|uniref:uncharacterized protein LOC132192588 isoform X2 n=1 Tax=Neocloeon triangulifer TaxID=2078957 RepID=UPI00286F5E3C|nr:uncharacterized protein LOC132192588 isoform X2 [Neocloeon triangulifer]
MGQTSSRISSTPSPNFRRLNRNSYTQQQNETSNFYMDRRPVTLAHTAEVFRPTQPPAAQPTRPEGRLNYTNLQPVDIYVEAIYSLQNREFPELSFKAGNYFKIKDVQSFHSNVNWVEAVNLFTGEEGQIPKNYVKVVRQIETEPWYFGTLSREAATELLMSNLCSLGSFLVRVSERDSSCLALSLRDYGQNGVQKVKHFKIKVNHEGRFFISVYNSFATVKALIEHHQRESELITLPCKLMKPCPKLSKPEPENVAEVPFRTEYARVNKTTSQNLPSAPSAISEVDNFDFSLFSTLPSNFSLHALTDPHLSGHSEDDFKDCFLNLPRTPEIPPKPVERQHVEFTDVAPVPRTRFNLEVSDDLERFLGNGLPELILPNMENEQGSEASDKFVKLDEKLGDGYFGDVWKGLWKGKEVTLMIMHSNNN